MKKGCSLVGLLALVGLLVGVGLVVKRFPALPMIQALQSFVVVFVGLAGWLLAYYLRFEIPNSKTADYKSHSNRTHRDESKTGRGTGKQREAGHKWCGRGDSNPHGLATVSPSSWCVCQFRHFRAKGSYQLSVLSRQSTNGCPFSLQLPFVSRRFRRVLQSGPYCLLTADD